MSVVYASMIIGRHNREGVNNIKPKNSGRPLTSEKPRTIRFGVRLDEKEHQELLEKAKKNNMKAAEFVRCLIKKAK